MSEYVYLTKRHIWEISSSDSYSGQPGFDYWPEIYHLFIQSLQIIGNETGHNYLVPNDDPSNPMLYHIGSWNIVTK